MSQLDDIHALMAAQEELDPELEQYFEEEGALGFPIVRHPLVYSVPHLSNAMANYQLRMKKEQLQRAKYKRDWSQYVYLHERPYRINAFVNICRHLGNSRYWKLLGNIYTDTENLWQNEGLWRSCLTADRRYRSHMMDADERAVLRNDIDLHNGTIYRGFCKDGRESGISWTTNSIVAKFFARRLAGPGDTPRLATGTVDRRDIIAFFDGRSEYEVLVLAEKVRDITITTTAKERAR